MYGLLIESIVEFVKRRYGNATWETIRKKAKLDNSLFSTHQQYSETLFIRIMKCLADITNTNFDELMELLGSEFVNFVSQYGYDRILRVLGRHMRDFLNGLDNLHEYMRFSYPKLKPPSFFVEKESPNGLVLHYRSKRKGFLHYVKGQIKQVGKIFYSLDVKIEVESEALEGDTSHVVFKLFFKNDHYNHSTSNSNLSHNSHTHHKQLANNLPMKSEVFFELFPFHIVFKKNMDIISIGDGLSQAMKHAEGESIKDLFNMTRPLFAFTWENIITHTNNIFELTSIEPIRRVVSPHEEVDQENSIYATQSSVDSQHDECLRLKGQMMYVREWEAIVFLATPVLENLDIMFNTGFYINDLSMHDSSRDLVLVGTQQSAELKLALDQEKQKSKALEDSMKKLDIEMKRTDQLLYQMIPKKIADRLRSGEPVMNLCEVVPGCTILFSDVVGFTSTCSLLTPMEVVSMLNGMYTKFDKALEAHNVYKVETIGDAYMVVSGLPEKTNNHAIEIIEMAFDMLNAISTLINPATSVPMQIRVGAHSGPVVAGVVGLKMPRYCLFGDTVNTASRMESTSEAMRIHISQSTRTLIQNKPYKVIERGRLEVKGKGEMKTYFVTEKVDEAGKTIRMPFMDVYEESLKNAKPQQVDHAKLAKDNTTFKLIDEGNVNTSTSTSSSKTKNASDDHQTNGTSGSSTKDSHALMKTNSSNSIDNVGDGDDVDGGVGKDEETRNNDSLNSLASTTGGGDIGIGYKPVTADSVSKNKMSLKEMQESMMKNTYETPEMNGDDGNLKSAFKNVNEAKKEIKNVDFDESNLMSIKKKLNDANQQQSLEEIKTLMTKAASSSSTKTTALSSSSALSNTVADQQAKSTTNNNYSATLGSLESQDSSPSTSLPSSTLSTLNNNANINNKKPNSNNNQLISSNNTEHATTLSNLSNSSAIDVTKDDDFAKYNKTGLKTITCQLI